MKAKATIAAGAVVLVGVAGLTPALAAKPKHKTLHGTWSFTDYTPDPSASVSGALPGGNDPYCHGGHVPPAPQDVNSHTLKIPGKGTLEVDGKNTGDWAMELQDPKGKVIQASDGGKPQDQEAVLAPLSKAGIYKVVFCNLTGAPSASATYSFKPKK